MKYYYRAFINCYQLKGDMGEAPTSDEILENTVGDGFDMLKELRSDNQLPQELRDSVEKIDHDFDLDQRIEDSYDEDENGTWGTIELTVVTNKELSDKEIEKLNEFYAIDCYWYDLFEDVEFELSYTE